MKPKIEARQHDAAIHYDLMLAGQPVTIAIAKALASRNDPLVHISRPLSYSELKELTRQIGKNVKASL